MTTSAVRGGVAVPPSLRAPGVLAFAACLSLSSGIAHFGVAKPHFDEWWAHGAFFVACGAAQVLYALLVLRRQWTPVLLAGIAGNLTVIALYVHSRTNGPAIGPHEGVPEPAGWYDMTTTAGELALVGLLVALLRPDARRWGMRLVVVYGLGLWTAKATGFLV